MFCLCLETFPFSVADPGFPVGGGANPLGGANLQSVHFSAKTYAKTKEMDPVGGGHVPAVPPLDPPIILHNFSLAAVKLAETFQTGKNSYVYSSVCKLNRKISSFHCEE